MSIADFFFGRKQNSTNNRRSAKLNRKSVRTRTLSMEPLETRDLLSVTTGPIDPDDYAALREQYPDFNLPEEQSTLNVMTVDCNLSDLKSALSTAGTTDLPDLILVKTTDSANTITYTSGTDGIKLDIATATKGSVTIIGWGTKELTIDANEKCRVLKISGSTDVNLGNLTITKGKVDSSTSSSEASAFGGGIYSTSTGTLNLNNCTISSNAVSSTTPYYSAYSYGGGIYSTGSLTLSNCNITNNSASSSTTSYTSSSTRPSGSYICVYAYGGGIYSKGSLIVTNCNVSDNSISSSSSNYYYLSNSQMYFPYNTSVWGGGIYASSSLIVTDSQITANAASSNNTSRGSSKSYSYGGGIYGANTLTLSNCEIANNMLSSRISKSSYDNTTSGSLYSEGGGIFNADTLFLTNCSISKNSVSTYSISYNTSVSDNFYEYSYGGGVYSSSSNELSITGSNILNNSLSGGESGKGGKDFYMSNNASSISLINSVVNSTSNSVAIFKTSGNAIIKNNSLTYVSISGGNGSVLNNNLSNSSISLSGNSNELSIIDRTMANSSISVSGNTSDLSISDSSLSSSSISISGSANELSINNSSLTSSYISVSGSINELSIIDSDISSTSAKRSIFKVSENALIKNCSFNYASFTSSGGNLSLLNNTLNNSSVSVSGEDATLLENTLTSAYFSISSGNVAIESNTLTNNAAYISISGGNVSVLDNSLTNGAYLTITNGEASVSNNTIVGTGSGKGISFSGGNTSLLNNILTSAPISISGGKISLLNDKLTSLPISVSGGDTSISTSSLSSSPVSVTDGNISFSGCSLSDATVSVSGGNTSFSDSSLTNAPVSISDGELSIVNSSLTGGTNISITDGTTSITNTSIVGTGDGKGIDITNGNIDTNLSIVNTLIHNYRFGIYTEAQINATIVNSTITNNSSYGICVENSAAIFSICNSIISNNSFFSDIYKTTNATINAYNSLSTFTDWSNGFNNYFYDSSLPLFKDANSSDYRLTENSQAINKGNNSYAVGSSGQPLSIDLAGNPRIMGGTVDLGAYEYDSRTALSVPEFSIVPNRTFAVVNVSPVENASAYRIEYSLNDDFTDSTTIDALEGENTLEDLLESQTYYVRVKSVGNNAYADSEYSTSLSFVTVPALTGLTLSTDSPTVGTTITTTLAPIGATALYQWYCGETEITGATDSSFKVSEAQIGKTITCVATGTGDYSGTISATTTETVPALPLDTPVLSSLNANNTVVVANWSLIDNADSYTFEYQLDGSENWTITTGLQGTSTAFIGNIGSTYNVRVKANGMGNYSDSPYSEIASITLTVPPTPLSGLTLSTNSPEVGTTITTTLAPSDATADYQWYSGETAIEGATESSFTVTEDQIGQTITCVATGTGEYSGTASATTAVVPAPIVDLDVPAGLALSAAETTVTATWSAVENASTYTVEYQAAGSDAWSTIPDVEGTSASFSGAAGTTYNVRVKANGTGNYTDSEYSEIEQITLDEVNKPIIAVNGKKISVLWTDASLAADSVRYRVAGTNKWTVKKLKAGVTEFSFNGALGTSYDIEVLLDQQETNVLQGSAIVLDQAKLKADKAFIKDDTFQVSVTNYAAKNLATNSKQAIVIVNGVQTTFNIENQEGSALLNGGGEVAFVNGLFTFTEMNSNTSYKVQISFSDGVSYATLSSALTVKTTKACYLAPEITSAVAVSDTSIVVAWETALGKKSNTPAQKYTVQYSLDGKKWSNATTAATGNSFTIQKLKGGAVYQVRVLASKDNAFEASAPSEVLTAETLAAPKTAIEKNSITDDTFQLNVTNYQTTNLTKATSINVKSDNFGETVINLENGAGSAAFDNGMTVAFNDGALTFANAPSNTQQKVQVNFSDGVCTTAWSAALTVKTTIAPYNKPNLTNATAVSSTSVLVEWSPVVGKNTDIPAQSYTVQYSTDGNRWINANTKVVGTSFTINGLKTGTNYLVAVIANKDSRFNASLPSESRQVTTL